MHSGERLRSAVTVWVLFALLLGGMTWIAFIIAGLRDDVSTERSARNALVQQVRDLGAKPVVGPVGPQGTPGKSGTDGNTGSDGLNGSNGKDGTDGRDGVSGADGVAGSDGEPGRDGEPGPQGEKGATGERGPVGPAGADGAPGADGADGAPGPSCPTGYSLTEKIVNGDQTMICVKTTTMKGR